MLQGQAFDHVRLDKPLIKSQDILKYRPSPACAVAIDSYRFASPVYLQIIGHPSIYQILYSNQFDYNTSPQTIETSSHVLVLISCPQISPKNQFIQGKYLLESRNSSSSLLASR